MINPRLKKIIFDKLYEDLAHIEIIPYKDSIWFIDREKEYWYLEYVKSDNLLYYRVSFFESFFPLFSMEYDQYELVLSEWVEEVLNYNVKNPREGDWHNLQMVREVLNYKVEKPFGCLIGG